MKNILLGITLLVTSCTAYLNDSPTYAVGAETLNRNSYYAVRTGLNYMFETYVPQYYEDHITDNLNSSTTASIDANRIVSTDSYANWTSLYSRVWACNKFIAALLADDDTTTPVDGLTVMHYLAEARFFRAYAYLLLTNYWGDVPWIDENTTVAEARVIARTKVADIMPKIFEDFKFTQTHARPRSISGPEYVSQEAATALLARLYLQVDDMANARIEAEKIIASPQMGITDNYWGIWTLKNARELIYYSAGTQGSVNAGWWFRHTTEGGRGSYVVHLSLVEDFAKEPTDSRSVVIIPIVGATNPYLSYQCVKYPRSTEDDLWPYARVAEMYLISAEVQGYPAGLSRLNELRVMRNLPPLTTATITNSTEYFEALMRERRLELCFEGFRWTDLRRMCKKYSLDITKYLPNLSGLTDHNLLFPVYQNEMDLNPNLVQNPGF